MNFKLPHWLTVIAAVVAASLVALGQQPQFAAYAALLNSLALVVGSVGTGVALHAPSIVHSANVQAVVGYEKAHAPLERGFVSWRPLLTLLAMALLALALPVFAAACTRAQAATDVATAISDTQAACVIAEDLIVATPAAPDIVYLEGLCGIAVGSESLVQKVLSTFFSERAAAMARVRAKNGVPAERDP